LIYLFDEVDARLQVHTEVNKYPFDTLAFILFLLEHEHMVVEKLLKFLIGEVDAELFESIELSRGGGQGKTTGISIREIVSRIFYSESKL